MYGYTGQELDDGYVFFWQKQDVLDTIDADLKKAQQQANVDLAAADKGLTNATQSLLDAQARQQQFLEDLAIEQQMAKEEEQQILSSRFFEVDTRYRIGMDAATLDVLYDRQNQLSQEQIDTFRDETTTEQRGGIPTLKVPWKTLAAFGVVGAALYYLRK
jgi:hypothetical protein